MYGRCGVPQAASHPLQAQSAPRAFQAGHAEFTSFRKLVGSTCAAGAARARFWVGVVEHAGDMEIIDTDGDHLHFQIDSSGSLQEFLNGQLEIDRITELHYDAASRMVTDDTGEFCLRGDWAKWMRPGA